MPMFPANRLRPYEIIAAMGPEAWARPTDRTAAVKVLPDIFPTIHNLDEPFEREVIFPIHTLASFPTI